MTSDFSKRALIIGGSHGVSLDLVKLVVARGVAVTAVSRTTDRLETDGLLEHDAVEHIKCDVVASEVADLPLPDELCGFAFCPGSINLGPLKTAKLQTMRQDFELNVVAAMKCFQAALPALRAAEHASAVFFTTVAVNRGIAMHSYVAAAKGALNALAKTWAAELAPHIRVNCVAPALTDTPLAQNLLSSSAKRQQMAGKYPLGRIGQPIDIAATADFLLSDQSSWITGQTIAVDGGMSTIVPL